MFFGFTFLLFIQPAKSCLYDTRSLKDVCDYYRNIYPNLGGPGSTTCNGQEFVGCEHPSGSVCTPGPNSCCLFLPTQITAYRVCPEGPAVKEAKKKTAPLKVSKSCGSVIYGEKQILSEIIPITGSEFNLVYSSEKVKGYKDWNYFNIPVTGPSFSSTYVTSAKLKIDVEGQIIDQTFPSNMNINYPFVWDGKDGLGNSLPNDTYEMKYSTQVVYGGVYTYDPPHTSEEIGPPLWVFKTAIIGSKLPSLHAGGWNINVNHFFDKDRNILFEGSGLSSQVEPIVRSTGEIWIISNRSEEVYVFNSAGKHFSTRHKLTGSTIYSFSYNSNGKLSKIEDAFGNETTLQYTGINLSSITSPYGQLTTITNDSNGYLATVSNPESETYSMTYSSDGLLLTFGKPNGSLSTLTYDSMGLLVSDSHDSGLSTILSKVSGISADDTLETSALGRVKRIQYGSEPGFEHSSTVINPSGLREIFSENFSWKETKVSENSSYSLRTQYVNDLRFPLQKATSKITGYNGYHIDETHARSFVLSDPTDPFSLTSLTTTKTIDSKTFQTVYTSASGSYVQTSPLGRITTSILDSHERLTSNKVGSYTPFTFSYDTRGRLSTVSQGSGRLTTLTYNTDGYLASSENALSQVISFTYDGAGRVLTETLPDSRVINYSYDSNGNIASITPPSKPSHSFITNTLDLIAQYLPPALLPSYMVNTTYTYNDDGQLTNIARPDGQSVLFNYGATTSNLNSIVLPSGTRTFGYNVGRINSAISEDGFNTYLQRPARMLTEFYVHGSSFNTTVRYDYNYAQLVSKETLSYASISMPLNFTYDNDFLLTGVGSETLTRSSSTGQITTINLGNVQENFSYSSSFGELSEFSAELGSLDIYKEEYLRDALGRITAKTVTNGSSTPDVYVHTYDSAGRLTAVTLNGSPKSSYSYEANSNRISQTLGPVTTTASYDDQDRLLTFGTKSFTYNNNGEVSSIVDSSSSSTTSLTYDVLGNLKSVTTPTKTINYKVDAFNNRVEKRDGSTLVHRYAWGLGNKLVAIFGPSNVLISRFVYGSNPYSPDYMIKGSDSFKIVKNHLGSPVMVINSSTGAIAQEVTYDEFGKIISDTSPGFTPFGFAGCLYDIDTKLCRFGARDYDASIGRWLSKDPILFMGGDTNLYGYVMQDPINLIDPSGLRMETESHGSVGSQAGAQLLVSSYMRNSNNNPADAWLTSVGERRMGWYAGSDVAASAEHYLYAYSEVLSKSTSGASMALMVPGYQFWKLLTNEEGATPPSSLQLQSGFQGTSDAQCGIKRWK